MDATQPPDDADLIADGHTDLDDLHLVNITDVRNSYFLYHFIPVPSSAVVGSNAAS